MEKTAEKLKVNESLLKTVHWNDRISKFAVQFIVMALNYIFSKLFVFRIKE